MSFTWWSVAAIVVAVGMALWDGISSPRRARRLRDTLKGGTGWHAETYATQRRKYRRDMRQIPIGAIITLCGTVGGFLAGWSAAIFIVIAFGLWSLTDGVVGYVCLRILGPPAQAAKSDVGLTQPNP